MTKNSSVIIVSIIALTAFLSSANAEYNRNYDLNILGEGKQLFQQICAECHGQQAQGTVGNWQEPGADAKYPPPPLNSAGHAWHHPLPALVHTVQSGTIDMGGSMPDWVKRNSH